MNNTFPLILAPMAGVTDKAFRHMCKKHGADRLVTEMVSAKAVCFGDEKTAILAHIDSGERPCSLQLFGSEPDIMAKAAVICAEKFTPDAIDVNMGCPAPKIVNNGDGSAVMKSPELAYEIIARMRDALDGGGFSDMPLTVKMRSGFDSAHINAVEVALMCEKGGAAEVTVHGRTREQMYAPPVNYDVIRDVKSALSIPVIANGNVFSASDALYVREYTGCDGLMIGRGSLGNPFLFGEVKAVLSGKEPPVITPQEWYSDVAEHMERLIADKGADKGALEARKHVAWYIRGIPGAADLRRRVNLAKGLSEILLIVGEAAAALPERKNLPSDFHVGNVC